VKYKKQILFFFYQYQRSSFHRPGEIKWHLMVASCYRRCGDYTAALEKYKWIHQHFPDDTDCKIKRIYLLIFFIF